MRGDGEGDRGDRHLDRDAVGLDGVQHGVEVESAVEPRACAGGDDGVQVEQPEDVERRRGDLQAVGVRHPECVDPVEGAVEQRAVRVLHRLGEPGRAGAEHHHGQAVQVDGRVDVWVDVPVDGCVG